MYSFNNDYSEGAHPQILNKIAITNLEQNNGYSEDIHTDNAIKYIKDHIQRQDVDVHILVGGTQTNLTCLSAFLRPHQSVISAETAHINVHETGAIEATGHKVLTVKTEDGKLTPVLIQQVLDAHTDEHMVQPKLVYISNSTEVGTIYRRAELIAIREFCLSHNLILFLDGARLGSALCSVDNDLTMEDIANLTDAFYIGGTKNGALFGEALIISKESLKEDFRFLIKQRGGMLAKGWLLGIQFEELFCNIEGEEMLFYRLAKHANRMAYKIKQGFVAKGYDFVTDSSTNQQFPILTNKLIEELSNKYLFSVNSKVSEDMTSVRFVTSWATDENKVDQLIEDLDLLP